MKLTKSIIDKLTYDKKNNKADIRWDSEFANFGIRIYPSGKKSFVLSYRHTGRKHIMVLGQYGIFTLAQAKDLARNELGKLRIQKEDPLELRYQHIQAETTKELCEQYISRYAKTKKKSWLTDERRIKRFILPTWGARKAVSITKSDIAKLHYKIGDSKPYEANRVLALISNIFTQARKWGVVPDSHINPARDIEKYKENKRDRWVTAQEMPLLGIAINNDTNEFAKYAIWLYLLTGARKTEILTSQWKNIDWDRKELKLIDTKSGNNHIIPLSSAAINLIQTIPRISKNPYIIVGLKEGSHMVNIDKAWRRIRKAANIEDVRLHDLRRTVGSMLVQSGSSLPLIGEVLNHSNQATTKIYAHFNNDAPRKALESHGNKLLELTSIKELN